PHAPHLTANEVNLVHRLWLRFSGQVAPEELHHHDVVHFALNEVMQEIEEGKEAQVVDRLRQHLEDNKARRKKPSSGAWSAVESRSVTGARSRPRSYHSS